MQLVKVLYCKLPTNSKQLPAFPLEAVPGTEPRPQRWEARVLPLCHRGPRLVSKQKQTNHLICILSYQSYHLPEGGLMCVQQIKHALGRVVTSNLAAIPQ